MVWFIVIACAAVILLTALVLTIIRFNQLSMARSLCDEAKRQLDVELRARHALVPAFIGTLQQITRRDLSSLELALASAERAPFGHRGAAAENALTRAIDEAVPGSGRLPDIAEAAQSMSAAPASAAGTPASAVHGGMSDELATTVELLHGQLSVLAERIVAVSRLYNANVDRYHRQRDRFLSRLFRRVFRSRDRFTEATAPEAGAVPGPGGTVPPAISGDRAAAPANHPAAPGAQPAGTTSATLSDAAAAPPMPLPAPGPAENPTRGTVGA